mmetsp:Transcript_19162/g.40151  ORF Transcript_19162/g.40151 Transcript_19162/m.40151 type:complete len:88 (-) Transcript_19162:3789-4052(-)
MELVKYGFRADTIIKAFSRVAPAMDLTNAILDVLLQLPEKVARQGSEHSNSHFGSPSRILHIMASTASLLTILMSRCTPTPSSRIPR